MTYRNINYSDFHQQNQSQNRGQDILLGLLGGAVGVMAMDIFSQQIMPMFESDDQQQSNGQQEQSQWQQSDALDSISVVGKHHRQQESSTAALGRMVYQWLTDDEPGQETKSMLSYGVHWGYGIAQGGLYGAWQGENAGYDLGTEVAQGVAFGTALWLFGDEGIVPMLGLQKGPTASPLTNHGERLTMHMVYGAATAAATHALKQMTT
ncbi:MAG: hypothetical protein KDE19_01225 [Caldilineaceae bacterium]|nr:hypothetical protein [Caldilineaceae bacterium]